MQYAVNSSEVSAPVAPKVAICLGVDLVRYTQG